jgi:hypothetical protein
MHCMLHPRSKVQQHTPDVVTPVKSAGNTSFTTARRTAVMPADVLASATASVLLVP